MITILYDKYWDDYRRNNGLRESFSNLDELMEWCFSQMRRDYTSDKYCMGFWQVNSELKKDLPARFELRPEQYGPELWIHQIAEDGSICFSDGTYTSGQKYWNNTIKCWMKKGYARQMHPVFHFAE